jgi:hypothetical protein
MRLCLKDVRKIHNGLTAALPQGCEESLWLSDMSLLKPLRGCAPLAA